MPDRLVSKLTGACQHIDAPNCAQNRSFCGMPDSAGYLSVRVWIYARGVYFALCLRLEEERPAYRWNLFCRLGATSDGMSGSVLSLSDFIQMVLFLHLLIPAVGECRPLA